MNIVNLALANIRKGKSAALSLFILIFIATLLLSIGLTVISQVNTFYDNKVQELHDSQVSIVMKSADYKQSYGDYIKAYPGLRETDNEPVMLLSAAEFRFGDNDLNSAAVLLNAGANRTIAPLKLIEELNDTHNDDHDIFVSYSFKTSGGYKLGGNFTITYQDQKYNYRVAGFFEDTMMGTNSTGLMKFFVPDAAYQELSDKLGAGASGTLLSAILTDSTQSTQMLDDYNKQFSNSGVSDPSKFYWAADIESMKSANTMTINIVAMILVAFAAVIVLVSLIVIRFRVTNSIDDGIVNIGILKAIGYTNGQIVASIALQFMLITFLAGVLGAAASYAAMPMFGGVISSLSGLMWNQSLGITINLASILIVALLVQIVTLIASIRIGRLHPVTALRGGMMTHSFKRNVFPLEKAGGGLHFVLACKTMIANRKQNFMVALIIVAITFASVFAVVLYYNIAIEKTAFVHLVGTETSNVMVQSKSGIDSKKLMANIEQMDDVAKVAIRDIISAKIDDQTFYTNISDDYSKMNNNTIYQGRYPQYDNEIAVSLAVAKLIHKGIGDTVKVEVGGTSYPFLITGLGQSISNMGQVTYLTLSGVQHLIPDYKGTMINVYLNGTDNASFIRTFKAQYGDSADDIMDIDETINSQSSIYVSAVFTVMVMILAITVLVVVLILYLVIKTMILKRKKEFGILKAMGYTTVQLMTQIALSFVPIVTAGVLIGGVLGYLYTNSVLTLLLSGAGIHNAQFIVNIPSIIMLCALLVVLAYLVSMIVSYRIKRITAYGLITE